MNFEFLGPYKVESLLGRGGMGTVYRGTHSKTGQIVAIKIIASTLADQERFRRRFAAEVETVKRLKQPNIVQLIGYGEEQGHLFYSMEYVPGVNLADHLKQHGPMKWAQAIQIGIEICAALKHAHDLGIIHRDLKPANVMLTETGQVKLTDFGIAKLFGSSDATAAGSVLGTADFMPPEQAEGKIVTNRSDLYSLGALLYCTLTGRSPHYAKTIPEVLYNVRYSVPASLEDVVFGTPSELSELIDELLRKESNERPPTALVVSNRLQSLRVGLQHRENQPQVDSQDVSLSKEFNTLDLFDNLAKSSDTISNQPGTAAGQPPLDRSQTFGTDVTQVVSLEDASSRLSASKENRTNLPGGRRPVRTEVANANTKSASSLHSAGPATSGSMNEEPASPGITRFTIVEENERRRSTLSSKAEQPASPWAHYISIGTILALLVGSLSAIYVFTRPQSADHLYRELSKAIESANPDDSFDVETALEQFEELYPTDPRLNEFATIKQDIQQQKALRRLERRARISSGQSELDPLEQAFLDSMKVREIDSDLAERKLRALLTIYSAPDRLTPKQQQLVQMAETALEEIKKGIDQKIHPATNALNDQIAWATTNLSKETQRAFFQSIIELYADKIWARTAVEQARNFLKKSESP